MSGPVDDDDAGAETDWVAVVVLVMVDGVVVLVGVEVVDMPSIDILVGVVVPPPAVVVVVLVVVVLAVVVVAPTAAVVIVVVVELAMDVVVLSAVVGGRLLHKHCGGTVEQFCKGMSGAGEQIQILTMNVCERSLCKCGQKTKHWKRTNAPASRQRSVRRREVARQKCGRQISTQASEEAKRSGRTHR